MNAPTGGFEAYQVVRSDGVTSFQVPALNFYPIVLTRPDGRYQKYYNVDLVEPDSALFRPPPGGRCHTARAQQAAARPVSQREIAEAHSSVPCRKTIPAKTAC